MTEPRAKLTLVQEALEAVPHQAKDEPTIARILDAFGPAYAKRIHADYRSQLAQQGKEHKAALDAATLAYEHAAAKAHKAGHAHGYHKAGWQFGIAGVVLGAVLACAAIFTMQKVIWDTATRSFREQAMTGALLSTHEERTPDYTQGTP